MADSTSTSAASSYTKTYTTFSGCDIVATFGNKVIGELQAITYSVQREKAPVYTMGSAEPRSFSRGKRGIAGQLVFTVFDRDALLAGLASHSKENFFRIGGKNNYSSKMSIDEWDSALTDMALNGVSGSVAKSADKVTANVAPNEVPIYADEIPPFDITISFANEYGQKATVVLYAVEILNEGTGYSIDTVGSEKACTFVARRVEYMRPVDRDGNRVDITNGSMAEFPD